MKPDSWHRCPVCVGPIEDVSTVIELTAEHMVGRDLPPEAIPDGARYGFYVEPCGHEATILQLREVGIEVERFEH
ncbi:hypothetical protein [Micromonospora sp. NBC_01813]|uniref:hypothetical protein n=1 Tax=Micromonospora sp. NBC_01813 TaxID=2975988 RepID=UPI002DDB143C|nr:hypothetical protein [Micromonospora sp. NBC_01813]WSA07024.1 hypothetical protein OG958_22535 [Micromonospora sp. NBC_01813]